MDNLQKIKSYLPKLEKYVNTEKYRVYVNYKGADIVLTNTIKIKADPLVFKNKEHRGENPVHVSTALVLVDTPEELSRLDNLLGKFDYIYLDAMWQLTPLQLQDLERKKINITGKKTAIMQNDKLLDNASEYFPFITLYHVAQGMLTAGIVGKVEVPEELNDTLIFLINLIKNKTNGN